MAEMPISVKNFLSIMAMLGARKISSRVAKDLLAYAVEDPRDPEAVAQERGLLQVEDPLKVSLVVDTLLAEHASVVEDYKKGKTSSLEYLVGQGMKAMRGAADPQVLRETIRSKIS
jgi:aspartyl-tRNA(Asn)/glutamyl-tRNA(Gln) amidotransferase subunit B